MIELKSYRAFKPKIHKQLCQVNEDLGTGDVLRNMTLLCTYPAPIGWGIRL